MSFDLCSYPICSTATSHEGAKLRWIADLSLCSLVFWLVVFYDMFFLVCFLCTRRGRLLVGTCAALFFNLLTLLSVRNKPFAYVSEGTIHVPECVC